MKKALSMLLQAAMIAVISIGVILSVVPWTYKSIHSSLELSEIESVKADMLKCNDKILETARTGSINKCFISISKGQLEVKKDGIYYTVSSNNVICSEHDWSLVERDKQVWQRCISGVVYQLRWLYPKNDVILMEGNIKITSVSGTKNYDLMPKGVLFVNFYSPEKLVGKNIEIERERVSEDTTTLKINVY